MITISCILKELQISFEKINLILTLFYKNRRKKMAIAIHIDRYDYTRDDPTERGIYPPVCAISLLATSVMLIAYSRVPFDCKTCPLTGSLITGIVITAFSFIGVCCSMIDCYKEGGKKACHSEKGRHIVSSICATFIALALGITGTVLISKVCPDLKC